MSAATLLERLDKVRCTAPGRWTASCPAHDDRRPSLSIRELPDGRILMKCWAGCSIHEVVSAMGLEIHDLFPHKPDDSRSKDHRGHRPCSALDVLNIMAFEAALVALYFTDRLHGYEPTVEEDDRLLLAYERLTAAAEVASA